MQSSIVPRDDNKIANNTRSQQQNQPGNLNHSGQVRVGSMPPNNNAGHNMEQPAIAVANGGNVIHISKLNEKCESMIRFLSKSKRVVFALEKHQQLSLPKSPASFVQARIPGRTDKFDRANNAYCNRVDAIINMIIDLRSLGLHKGQTQCDLVNFQNKLDEKKIEKELKAQRRNAMVIEFNGGQVQAQPQAQHQSVQPNAMYQQQPPQYQQQPNNNDDFFAMFSKMSIDQRMAIKSMMNGDSRNDASAVNSSSQEGIPDEDINDCNDDPEYVPGDEGEDMD